MLGYAQASAGVHKELVGRHQMPIGRVSYLMSDHQDLVAFVLGRRHSTNWTQPQPHDHLTRVQLATVCASLATQLDPSDADDRPALARLESVLEHFEIAHLLFVETDD